MHRESKQILFYFFIQQCKQIYRRRPTNLRNKKRSAQLLHSFVWLFYCNRRLIVTGNEAVTCKFGMESENSWKKFETANLL